MPETAAVARFAFAQLAQRASSACGHAIPKRREKYDFVRFSFLELNRKSPALFSR